MRRRALAAILGAGLAGALSVPADGGELRLEGAPIQGGLVVGRAEPGARVHLDGRRLRVSADGLFLFGFGRDAGPTAKLVVRHADGTDERRVLEVAKRTYKVQRIDGLPPKMVTPGPEELKRIRAEQALINRARNRDTPNSNFAARFRWPALGRVSGVYGSRRILNGRPRRPHFGLDIAAPAGAPVVAPAPGEVALVHEGMYFTGKTVMLDHGHGLTSIFIHMSAIAVKAGQKVRRGALIGRVGQTGRATGPHLHWGLNWFGVRLDPARLVGPMPSANPRG